MGGEAVLEMLKRVDVHGLSEQLRHDMRTSTSEAKRLIAQGGVEVDGRRVTDDQHKLSRGGRYLVRVGSKKRRFCFIRVPT